MKLSLGFSTCPNDTFIFDAMIHEKVDTEGLNFEVVMADVEELNTLALKGDLDITKLSYFAYAYCSKNYKILNAGSALGRNNGPLLISKHKIYPDELNDIKIGIPGKNTTANLLLSIAFPKAINKKEYLFSDIEEVVLSNEIDAGLIIHENRFTYKERGLKKIVDFGEYWEQNYNQLIPLGGITIKRNINFDIQKKVDRVIKRSIEYAFNNPNSSYEFMKQYAQDMKPEVMKNHINLYVNEYTLNLGDKGKEAINFLYNKAQENNIIKEMETDLFV